MSLIYTVRPLSRPVPVSGVDPHFTAAWRDTQALLEREIWHLGAQRLVIEMAVREQDLRVDGMLRANARPEHQGVAAVLLGTERGDLRLAARLVGSQGGAYEGREAGWQANVRAIALTLESLRRIERYGTTPENQQYDGFRALPASTSQTDVDRGRALVAQHGGYRQARAATHPDAPGGSHTDFIAVEAWHRAWQEAERAA